MARRPSWFRTGGLADTVVDANAATLADASATGFVFDSPDVVAFLGAIRRALELYRQLRNGRLQQSGMRQSFDWQEAPTLSSLYSW